LDLGDLIFLLSNGVGAFNTQGEAGSGLNQEDYVGKLKGHSFEPCATSVGGGRMKDCVGREGNAQMRIFRERLHQPVNGIVQLLVGSSEGVRLRIGSNRKEKAVTESSRRNERAKKKVIL